MVTKAVTIFFYAIDKHKIFAQAAYQRAKELTGLENPGSVNQLKAWLADQDMPMESLAKKDRAGEGVADGRHCGRAAEPAAGTEQNQRQKVRGHGALRKAPMLFSNFPQSCFKRSFQRNRRETGTFSVVYFFLPPTFPPTCG